MRSAAALSDGPSAHRAPALAEINLAVPNLIAELTGRADRGVGAPMRREAALDLLRRHLAGCQEGVQTAFEARELSGLSAARAHGQFRDQLRHAEVDLGQRRGAVRRRPVGEGGR